MIIRSYTQFLLKESKSVYKGNTISDYREEMALLENEYLRMQQEGWSEERINENIFTSLLGSLGGGFGDTFKDYVIDWAAEKLGIRPMDMNGKPTFFYQVIRNVIESVHFSEIGSYFGKGSCKKWSVAIVEGLSETLQERGLDYLLSALGLEINMNTGMGGTISASLREAITNAINNTEFANKVEGMISDKICGFKLGDVLSSTKVDTSDKQVMQGEIEKAGEENPDIYTKIMKSGLGNFFQFNN
jgi:hypothetical protein